MADFTLAIPTFIVILILFVIWCEIRLSRKLVSLASADRTIGNGADYLLCLRKFFNKL